jgi:hypothetical protein
MRPSSPVDDVEVQVQALPVPRDDAPTAGEREAGGQLDGGEDPDQTLCDAVPLGDLPREIILAVHHTPLEDVRLSSPGGDALVGGR